MGRTRSGTRGRLRSEAKIFDAGRRRDQGQEPDSDGMGEDLVDRYMNGIGTDGDQLCHRVVLDEYLDGRMDRIGCEDGEEMCDVCGGKIEMEEEKAEEEEVEEEIEEEIEEKGEMEKEEGIGTFRVFLVWGATGDLCTVGREWTWVLAGDSGWAVSICKGIVGWVGRDDIGVSRGGEEAVGRVIDEIGSGCEFGREYMSIFGSETAFIRRGKQWFHIGVLMVMWIEG